MKRLEECLTPNRADGYRLLWQLLLCLKETTSQNLATGGGVVVSFIEALLTAHYIYGDYVVSTDECWEMLDALASEAMKWWHVTCKKWCECSADGHKDKLLCIEYTARSMEIPKGALYRRRSAGQKVDGVWKYDVTSERVESCSMDECRDRSSMYLIKMGPCTDHFRIHFHGGCDPTLLKRISDLETIPFNGEHYAVWGGIWKFDDHRTDACYMVLKANGEPQWVRWNSQAGRLTVEKSLDPLACVDLLFVRPGKTCWCGEYNDDTMFHCTRRDCKKSAHRRCIQKAWPRWQGKSWGGGKNNHCQQPGCEEAYQARAAARKRKQEAKAAGNNVVDENAEDETDSEHEDKEDETDTDDEDMEDADASSSESE